MRRVARARARVNLSALDGLEREWRRRLAGVPTWPPRAADPPTRWYTLPMPIYEFICNACATPFEELIRNGTKPVCPSCGTGDVRRLLSSFAVHSSSPGMGGQGASKNCSSCASSSCATCH